MQFANHRAMATCDEAADFVGDTETGSYVRYGWADPRSSRSLPEHIASMKHFLDADDLKFGLSHWTVDGDSLVIAFSFGMGITGNACDVQAFQWYTVCADPSFKYGFRIASAHMLPVATSDGKTSAAVWPSAYELLPLFRPPYSQLGRYNPEVAALKRQIWQIEHPPK